MRTTIISALISILGATSLSAQRDQPNIIFILTDDLGYGDLGFTGHPTTRTPTLDALAHGGRTLSTWYSACPVCSCSRASLLTGINQHQAGIGLMTGDNKLPGYRGELGRDVVTIAEALSAGGYRRYMSGKWHVTKHTRPQGPKDNWPLQRGFEKFYGTIIGAGSFFDPATLCRGNQFITPVNDDKYQPKTYYYTDAISDHAARYIKEHKGDNPFFIYVAYTAPHWPMHALPKDIAKYKGKYDAGWDALRKARHARQLKMSLVDPKWKISPRDSKATPWADAKNRAWELRLMETYAAMVDNMDQGMGRIVQALKDNGKYDNTLILFLADNGGCAEGMGRRNGIQYRDKNPEKIIPMAKDALQFDMIPKRTRDGRVVKQGTEVMTGDSDTVSYTHLTLPTKA